MRECSRCRRPAPDSGAPSFATWRLDEPPASGLVCPGCLTRIESRNAEDDLTIALMELDVGDDDGPQRGRGRPSKPR
jgi:hypothetical protein